jgi:hypothetical protein
MCFYIFNTCFSKEDEESSINLEAYKFIDKIQQENIQKNNNFNEFYIQSDVSTNIEEPINNWEDYLNEDYILVDID